MKPDGSLPPLPYGGSSRIQQGQATHATPYLEIIDRVSRELHEDPALVASIIDTEDSAPGSTSPAGARGLGQVLPNYVAPGEDPFDPETSIRQTIRAIQDKRNILQQQGYDATPEQVAGRYFGNGVDAGGMTTAGYQQRFREKYGNYSVVNGPPIPVTSGEGQVTIQHNATGQQYQITESQWRDMQSVDGNAADFTVVQQAAKPGADLRSQLTQPTRHDGVRDQEPVRPGPAAPAGAGGVWPGRRGAVHRGDGQDAERPGSRPDRGGERLDARTGHGRCRRVQADALGRGRPLRDARPDRRRRPRSRSRAAT
jgi:hypothetical protein